jgi:hypothetical protein
MQVAVGLDPAVTLAETSPGVYEGTTGYASEFTLTLHENEPEPGAVHSHVMRAPSLFTVVVAPSTGNAITVEWSPFGDLGAFDGYGDAGTWVTLRDATTHGILAQAHIPDTGLARFSLSNFTAAGTYPIEVKRTLNEAPYNTLTIVTNYNYQP